MSNKSNENQSGAISCSVMCWIIGALLGLATYLVLSGRFEMGMVVALIAAVVVAIAMALVMGRLFCQGQPNEIGHPARHDHDIAATRKSVVEVDSIGGGDLAMAPSVPELADEKPSAADDAVSEASAPKVEKTDDGDTVKSAVNSAKRPVTKAKMTGSTKKPVTKAAPKSKAKAASKTNAKPATSDTKPEMLKKARTGGADDLKQIKGVGPKLEQMLNEMGVYHFDQVSGWSADEVKWADENIKGVKGRVSRDEWVKQAKILAAGGATEFSKKVKKGGVYDKNKK